MARPKLYIGIDIETSGTDWRRHGILQVGAAVKWWLAEPDGTQRYVSDRGWLTFGSDVNVDDHEVDPEATKIHGFSEERMRGGLPGSAVDDQLAAFLEYLASLNGVKHRLIPVGWNVAGFDMQFIANQLPRSCALLSYQTSDLNAAAFLLSDALGIDFSKLKERSKRYAARELGGEELWHDALYDARASLLSREYYVKLTARLSDILRTARGAEEMLSGPWADEKEGGG